VTREQVKLLREAVRDVSFGLYLAFQMSATRLNYRESKDLFIAFAGL